MASLLQQDTANKLRFKIKKHITLPLLKIPDNGTPIYVTLTDAIFKAKNINAAAKIIDPNAPPVPAAAAPVQQPPELVHIVDLTTNAPGQMIVSSVFGHEIRNAYPNDGYVGKSFEILKFKMQGGKKYATFQITEIETESDEEVAKEEVPKQEAAKPVEPAHAAAQGKPPVKR